MADNSRPLSLQERFAPDGVCYGCGQANPQGFRIRSFEEGDEVVAEWGRSHITTRTPGC